MNLYLTINIFPNLFENVQLGDCSKMHCSINLQVNLYSNITNLLSNDNIKELINEGLQFSQLTGEKIDNNLIQSLLGLKNSDEKLNKFKNIVICSDNFDAIKLFFDNNKYLKQYDVVIDYRSNFYGMKKDNIYKFLKTYNNCRILIKNNKLPIDAEEFKKTIDFIDDICDKTVRFKFSPLENIMYVYDIVRGRIYKREDQDESIYMSRDLSKVILGDKIVCVGFTGIFSSILDRLGFEESLIELSGKENGRHIRNQVAINDDKYNVFGIYNFDSTWGCKKNDNDLSYLSSYLFFAKTDSQLKYIHQKNKFNNLIFDEEYIKQVEKKIIENGVASLDYEDIHFINSISRKIGDNFILPGSLFNQSDTFYKTFNTSHYTVDDAIAELHNYFKIFNTKITYNILLKVLYNVRKCQYYENPELFDFDINSFCSIVENSNWIEHEYDNLSMEDKLLAVVLNNEIYKDYKRKNKLVKREIKKDYGKDIEVIKLTRILRTYLDSQTQNNSKR